MMNINLKKIKILEPKVKITTGLKTIKSDFDNSFSVQQLVENISKSVTNEQFSCSIYSSDVSTLNNTRFAMYCDSISLGIRTKEYSDNFKHVYCGLYLYSDVPFTRILGENAWYVTSNAKYTGTWFNSNEDGKWRFYGYVEFASHHPVYNDSVFLSTNEEKIINLVNKYKIGDIFNTGISSTDKLIIFYFNNGTYNLYKSNKDVACTVTQSGDTYNFSWNSQAFVLGDYLEQNYRQKQNISYRSSSGAFGIIPTTHIIVSTFDIYDTNGNLIFGKNANIGDYI